jgi:hypothetical protein
VFRRTGPYSPNKCQAELVLENPSWNRPSWRYPSLPRYQMSTGCLSSIVPVIPVPVTIIGCHSYVISPLTHIVTPVVMESLSMTPYLWLSIRLPSYAISYYCYKSSRLWLHCFSIVSPYVLPLTQTRIYTSLLAPLWRQVESPVSFPETETLLPIFFLPFPSVGLLSGTQSTTLPSI